MQNNDPPLGLNYTAIAVFIPQNPTLTPGAEAQHCTDYSIALGATINSTIVKILRQPQKNNNNNNNNNHQIISWTT